MKIRLLAVDDTGLVRPETSLTVPLDLIPESTIRAALFRPLQQAGLETHSHQARIHESDVCNFCWRMLDGSRFTSLSSPVTLDPEHPKRRELLERVIAAAPVGAAIKLREHRVTCGCTPAKSVVQVIAQVSLRWAEKAWGREFR